MFCGAQKTMGKPDLKLTYFDLPGRAEPIRVLLHLAGSSFEDERLTFDQWPARQAQEDGEHKPQVPFLYVDGNIKLQSLAIMKYAGTLAGLVDKDPLKALNEDMVVCMTDEFKPAWAAYFLAGPDKKEELARVFREEVLPKYISKLETTMKHAGPGPYAANNKLSVADVAVWSCFAPFIVAHGADLYPKHELAKLDRIKKAIANVQSHPKVLEYYSTRPEQKKMAFVDL